MPGIVFKPASSAAMAVRPRVNRMVAGMRNGEVRTQVIDGFILKAVYSGPSIIVYAIDTPAQITWLWFATFPGGSNDLHLNTLHAGDRSTYAPGGKPPAEAVVAAVDKTSTPVFEAAEFVPPASSIRTIKRVGGAPIKEDGEWVYAPAISPSSSDSAAAWVSEVYVLGIRWDTPMRRYELSDPGFSLTEPPEGGARASASRLLVMPVSAVISAAGAPDVAARQLPSNVLLPSISVQGDSVITALCAHDYDSALIATPEMMPVVLVWRSAFLMPDAPPGSSPSVAWATCLRLADDPVIPAGSLSNANAFDYSGIHVGETVTVLAPLQDTGSEYYVTTLFELNKENGSVIGKAVWAHGQNTLAVPLCATKAALWAAYAQRTPGSAAWSSCVLVRIVGMLRSTVSTPGYSPVCGLTPGALTDGYAYFTQSECVAVDVSDGRVLVAVLPSSSHSNATPLPVSLIELNTDTLEVVSVRGVAGMQANRLVSVHLSVVTPQKLSSSGEVLVHAVLLCNIGTSTRISNDGGMTWGVLSVGFAGKPVYRGNHLHQTTPALTL